jgi:fluoroquinolone transport system permease protein
MLERQEGSLHALAATPMRVEEFLSARFVAMAVLSTLLAFAIIGLLAIIKDFTWHPWQLFFATVLSSLFFAMVGFLFAAPFARVTDLLMTSVLLLFLLALPILDLFSLLAMPWRLLLFIIPSQAALVLLHASFAALPLWEVMYGYLYLLLSLVFLFRFSIKIFSKFYIGNR